MAPVTSSVALVTTSMEDLGRPEPLFLSFLFLSVLEVIPLNLATPQEETHQSLSPPKQYVHALMVVIINSNMSQ